MCVTFVGIDGMRAVINYRKLLTCTFRTKISVARVFSDGLIPDNLPGRAVWGRALRHARPLFLERARRAERRRRFGSGRLNAILEVI